MGHRLLALTALFAAACTNNSTGTKTPYHPDASCPVTIDAPVTLAAKHVDVGTAVTYASNPPAGGPHYPVWATWGVHTTLVPRPYYVHNLEHGGVVLLYKCDDAGTCASSEAFLKSVMAAMQTDTSCQPPVRVRVVITKDDAIPTPFAAAAWGWTYAAECADMGSLLDFVKEHYGHGPENLCNDGQFQ